MDEDLKAHEGEKTVINENELLGRRGFLVSLRKWSMVVIGGALLGGAQLTAEPEADAAGAWANRAGGWRSVGQSRRWRRRLGEQGGRRWRGLGQSCRWRCSLGQSWCSLG